MFFLYFTTVIILLFILLYFLSIQIKIKELEINNQSPKFVLNYKIIFSIDLFKKIPIFRIKLDNKKIKNIVHSEAVQKLSKKIKKNQNNFDKKVLKIYKYITINDAHLEILLGTEEAQTTAILVGVISGILGIILKNEENDNFFEVRPSFIGKNILTASFDGKISIQIVQYLYMLAASTERKTMATNHSYKKAF